MLSDITCPIYFLKTPYVTSLLSPLKRHPSFNHVISLVKFLSNEVNTFMKSQSNFYQKN